VRSPVRNSGRPAGLPKLLLVGLLAGAALLAGCNRGPDPDLEVLPIGGDFKLVGHDGKPFDSRSLRGQVVWVFFGYTSCPDICPTTLARLSKAREILAEEKLSLLVKTAFISVDPERDTPQVMKDYLGYFSLPVNGITGAPEEIAAVAKSYGAGYERAESSSAAGYLVNHTTYVYLLDGQGRVRHLFGHDDSPERIAELTIRLLRDASCFHNPA